MGSVWRRLGTKVTVIEFLDHIVPGTDKDVGKTFLRLLKKQGMKFKLKTKVTSSELQDNGKVKLTMEPSKGGDAKEDEFDVVLTEVPADKKIAVLKIVRTITGLGLKEAKGMVESAPVTIKEGAPKDEAADIQKQIEEGGAKVELK